MDSDNKARFGLQLALLGETFDKDITRTRLQAYWIGLQDLPLDRFEQAVHKAIEQSEFFPTPAALRKLAGYGSGEEFVMMAFSVVLKSIARFGPYKHVDFQDVTINATIRNLGGWPTFVGRFTDAEAEKWARLEFIKTYSAFRQSGIDGDAARPLPGLSTVEPPRIYRIACPIAPAIESQPRGEMPLARLKQA